MAMGWNGVTGNREYGEEEKDDIRFSRCTECDNSDGACFGGRGGDICEAALEGNRFRVERREE